MQTPENAEAPSVMLATNKRYFVEDKFLVVDCYHDQKKMRPLLKDWIGLYPCENAKLDEPLIFEYVMDHPRTDNSCFTVRFIPRLFAKSIHCSGKYQFVYVDSHFKIVATSDPIQFVHKNDCNCNIALGPTNSMTHVKIGEDIAVVLQRLKCMEAKLLEYEDGKKEAFQLNELLVKKLKACEMLRSRGEQFIDGLYNALDQGKPVKLINSKGLTRWIKRMRTSEMRNHIMSTKTVRNDLFLTAIINTQEQEIQRLKAINIELISTLPKHNERLMNISEPFDSDTDDSITVKKLKAFTIESVTPAVVKFIDDSDIGDDCRE